MKELAIVGLATIFCFSGQVAHKGNQELATTKSFAPAKDDGTNKKNGESEKQSSVPRSDTQKTKGKSAARRVIEGIGPSNSMVDVERKSAAQKSMEEI